MKKEILKCPKCSTYTLQSSCPNCNSKTLSPKPAKFSINDKYGKYRRIAKLKNV
ncbi:MAG: RNA-protein complex protein Nop10 [Nanoarchaeota archaeon]|nr:RNA-protein complex protein Nop10 [Nanoarchaeota archaeon]